MISFVNFIKVYIQKTCNVIIYNLNCFYTGIWNENRYKILKEKAYVFIKNMNDPVWYNMVAGSVYWYRGITRYSVTACKRAGSVFPTCGFRVAVKNHHNLAIGRSQLGHPVQRKVVHNYLVSVSCNTVNCYLCWYLSYLLSRT